MASEKVVQLVLLLFAVGEEQLAEVRAIESDYDEAAGVPQIELANAIELAAKTDALLLDLRPVEEYEAGHLPKALNLPIDEFDQKKLSFPKRRPSLFIVAGANVAMLT